MPRPKHQYNYGNTPIGVEEMEYERLRQQGHSPAQIAKAKSLLDSVKAGVMTMDEAQAILRGEPMPFPTHDKDDPTLLKRVLPRTLDEADATMEEAFSSITEE